MSTFHANAPDWDAPVEPFEPDGEVILIVGDVGHGDLDAVQGWLAGLYAGLPKNTVITTCGRAGVEAFAHEVAKGYGLRTATVLPDWRAHPRAEHWRAEAERDLVAITGGELHGVPYPPASRVLAFQWGNGTAARDAAAAARAAGLKAVLIGEDGRKVGAEAG